MSATLWRARPYATVLGLLLAVAPVWPGRAAQADTPSPNTESPNSHSAPTQSGWWNRLQGPAEGEPDGNPLRPLVPAAPKPPTVPADAIATSAGGSQDDKVAAVGIDLGLADGAGVERLVLRLVESKAEGANVGSDKAKVTACPATVPWGPSQNAAWRERPAADCKLGSADGVRAADGTWTFDLTAIARLWTGAAPPLAPNGVVLAADPAASPSPVQISWLDVDSGHVAVDLTAAPPAPGPAAAAPVPVVAASAPAPAGPPSDTAADARAFPASADPLANASVQPTFASTAAGPDPSGSDPSGSDPSGSDSSGVGPAPAGPAEVALESAPGSPPAPVLRARPAVDFWEHVPGAAALLIPVVAGLAVLIGLVLGPTGRPAPVFRREGGLSRALARRRPAA